MAEAVTPLRFSPTHGQNVRLNEVKSSSSWYLDHHWGVCFLDRCMQKGDDFHLKITGSGHIFIGLVSGKPNPEHVKEGLAPKRNEGSHWIHLHLKKNSLTVRLKRRSNKEVTFSGDNNGDIPPDSFKVGSNAEVWICLDINFGDIETQVIPNGNRRSPILFDTQCGLNVEVGEDRSTAKLKMVNPGAVCSTDRPLVPGEIVELDVQPVEEARWTFVNIFLTNAGPRNLMLKSTNRYFNPASDLPRLFPLPPIKNVKGIIQLRITPEGKVAYTVSATEKQEVLEGLDLYGDIYLCLELFRVKATLRSTLPSAVPDEYWRIARVPSFEGDDYLQPIPDGSDTIGQNKDFRPRGGSVCAEQNDIQDAELSDLTCELNTMKRMSRKRLDEVRIHRFEKDMETIHKRLEDLEKKTTYSEKTRRQIMALKRTSDEIACILQKSSGHESGNGSLENRIRKHYIELLEKMEPEAVADYLFQHQVITYAELEKMHDETCRRNKCRRIMGFLLKRSNAEAALKEALERSAQQHLVELLKL